MATVHEAWRMYHGTDFDAKQDGKLLSALHCFSILNNGRKILSMRVAASSDNFGCIHGIRFFSTCWVVLAHNFTLAAGKIMNIKSITEVNQLFHANDIIQILFSGFQNFGHANDWQFQRFCRHIFPDERLAGLVPLAP
jgi:hypothetical protein